MSNPNDLYGDVETRRRLLQETEIWAVVGLSDNAQRPAFGVARFLQAHGKRIVPIHPSAVTVHGERGYPTLADAMFEIGHIEVIDIFVNSAQAGRVVDDAIAIGASAIWMQLGVVDEHAALRARQSGLDTVMNRCPAIEWPALIG
jgi:predicted CoA-binding protein